MIDSVVYIHKAISEGKRVLVEGANALMLDIDFGTYPFVTSSATTIGGVCTGLGIPPKLIGTTIGVIKAYTTRVGGGPFPTEQLNVSHLPRSRTREADRLLHQDVGVHLQEVGREFGVTTGRRRRCGWLDLVVMNHSCLINGYDALNLTKLDILDDFKEIQVAVKYILNGQELPGFPGKTAASHRHLYILTISYKADLGVLEKVQVEYVTLPGWQSSIASVTSYDNLPENCKKYIEFVEEFLKVPIEWIGVGPGREAMIQKSRKTAS